MRTVSILPKSKLPWYLHRPCIFPNFSTQPLENALHAKKEDYLEFVQTAELIKSKDHLTDEGLEKIKLTICDGYGVEQRTSVR